MFQVGHNIKTKNCERGGSEEKAIAETMSAYLIELRICQHCIFLCPGFLLLIQGLRPKWRGQQLLCILIPNKLCPLKCQRSAFGRMLENFDATEGTSKRGNENVTPWIRPCSNTLRELLSLMLLL